MANLRVFTRQPVYLPGIIFFDQLIQVDLYIIYDIVQYERRKWGNRNLIRNYQKKQWITVPIHQHGNRNQTYENTKIDNSTHWADQHWKSLYHNYSHAPYFSKYAPFFEATYQKSWDNLVDLNLYITKHLANLLKIDTPIIKASDVTNTSINSFTKTQKLIYILNQVKGKTYVSGQAAKSYLNPKEMEDQGIDVYWHEFTHPKYNQFQGGFIEGLSVIDLIFNYGPKSRSIINLNKVNPKKAQ